MKPQRTEIPCPKCGREGVEALHYHSYLEHHTSRIAAGAKTTYHREQERYELVSGCKLCGKSLRELQEIEREGPKTGLSHEERLKRLQEQGLPTQIRSNYDNKQKRAIHWGSG